MKSGWSDAGIESFDANKRSDWKAEASISSKGRELRSDCEWQRVDLNRHLIDGEFKTRDIERIFSDDDLTRDSFRKDEQLRRSVLHIDKVTDLNRKLIDSDTDHTTCSDGDLLEGDVTTDIEARNRKDHIVSRNSDELPPNRSPRIDIEHQLGHGKIDIVDPEDHPGEEGGTHAIGEEVNAASCNRDIEESITEVEFGICDLNAGDIGGLRKGEVT